MTAAHGGSGRAVIKLIMKASIGGAEVSPEFMVRDERCHQNEARSLDSLLGDLSQSMLDLGEF